VATKAKSKTESLTQSGAKTSTSKVRTKKKGSEAIAADPAPQTPKRAEAYQKALQLYEEALAHLGAREIPAARAAFERILAEHDDEAEVCDRARIYLRFCDRTDVEAPAAPQGLEQLYLHGVYHANRGEFDQALSYFDQGLSGDPEAEDLLYASAVVLAQGGRPAEAMKRLSRAIAVNSANRILALNDPDFESVRDEPEFIDLVEPEESRGA